MSVLKISETGASFWQQYGPHRWREAVINRDPLTVLA
jgi:hypothetical protein